ncbi:transposase [Streptomyces sp. NPDC058623]|uniref:transposase n=1 Tax=Streptomyces sp. NPDC058623 TaxID=3346563 RepID=UPI00365153A5
MTPTEAAHRLRPFNGHQSQGRNLDSVFYVLRSGCQWRMLLVWDDLAAHWSRAMRAWVAEQDWLTMERLPAYAPELNPVELLCSSLKKRELASLAGDHLADATEQGNHRINHNPQLPWSFLTHTGLTIHPPNPPNLRKDQ